MRHFRCRVRASNSRPKVYKTPPLHLRAYVLRTRAAVLSRLGCGDGRLKFFQSVQITFAVVDQVPVPIVSRTDKCPITAWMRFGVQPRWAMNSLAAARGVSKGVKAVFGLWVALGHPRPSCPLPQPSQRQSGRFPEPTDDVYMAFDIPAPILGRVCKLTHTTRPKARADYNEPAASPSLFGVAGFHFRPNTLSEQTLNWCTPADCGYNRPVRLATTHLGDSAA